MVELRDDGSLGVGFETVYADLFDVHCYWLLKSSSDRRWGSIYARANVRKFEIQKCGKRAITLNVSVRPLLRVNVFNTGIM